jgi:hypothetical protein
MVQPKFFEPPTIQDAWIAETERFEYDWDYFETANSAELADELELYRIQALADPNFDTSYCEWDLYILESEIWLALEQCCSEGVLLPMDQRALRVKTCPDKLLRPLGRFFEVCPQHVKHHLALTYYLVVRIERARRTGRADWSPHTAQPRDPMEGTVFFRPPKLTVRRYTG